MMQTIWGLALCLGPAAESASFLAVTSVGDSEARAAPILRATRPTRVPSRPPSGGCPRAAAAPTRGADSPPGRRSACRGQRAFQAGGGVRPHARRARARADAAHPVAFRDSESGPTRITRLPAARGAATTARGSLCETDRLPVRPRRAARGAAAALRRRLRGRAPPCGARVRAHVCALCARAMCEHAMKARAHGRTHRAAPKPRRTAAARARATNGVWLRVIAHARSVQHV
jgi:hypothetical protein